MRPFVDTNVLVYALSGQDLAKQQVAQRLLAERGALRPSLSTQVLAETFSVLTRKLRWRPDDALAAVTLLKRLRVVALTPETQLDALRLAMEHRLSGWDAMVVQAALQAGCDVLYSEDLQPGRRFGALAVANPFEAVAQEPPPRSRAEPRTTPGTKSRAKPRGARR